MASIFVISDCHGNYDGLIRALERKKIIDKKGNRQLARKHKIVSIGDLANCVGDSIVGDNACIDLVGEVIDIYLMGNHEIPYLDPANKFWGFVFDPVISHKIHSLNNEGFIGPAVLAGNTLISHAGFSKNMMSVKMGAQEIYETLEKHWENNNFAYSAFSNIGRARGGMSPYGGILWCDFENEFVPTDFPQIVGHTPKYVRTKGNALCIDVGAKDQETEPFILEVS
jgi:hypothetical protein